MLELALQAPQKQLIQCVLCFHAAIENVIYRAADGQLYAIGLTEMHQSLDCIVSFSQFIIGFALHPQLAKAPVIAIRGKHSGFIISQMAQPISGQFIAPPGADQFGNLPGTPGHQRTL